MIKEIVQFTQEIANDHVFRNYNATPKEGLHIVLSVIPGEEGLKIAEKPESIGVFSKKVTMNAFFEKCAAWGQSAWMVDTNKCFDTPTKAVHSASPFCFALKRTNLDGGEQYLDNQAKGKSQVYERVELYFNKALALIDAPEEQKAGQAFCRFLKSKDQVNRFLAEIQEYTEVKDGEYVCFYLDLPLSAYAAANQKYLKEKLFNTSEYNITDTNDDNLIHGTSNWLNGFPSKKPFLQHQSATFDISARISSVEAQALYDFSDLMRRKALPNPLPIFIMEDERKTPFKIYKNDLLNGGDKRKAYLEIMEEIRNSGKAEIGNYYLLFMSLGEVKDFDFVSRFDFNLNKDGSQWEITDLFGSKETFQLVTVVDLMTQVLPPMFNNALIVRRKEKDWIYRWFDEIDPSYCKTHNAFLMAMKYRKGFYDFIYKSQRQSITDNAIREILMTGILDDIRLDKYEGSFNSELNNIRTKLNLLFNLQQYFSNKPNTAFMAENIIKLREQLELIAKGEASIASDAAFAFAAGQVVARVFKESNTGDKSFKYLEPFLAQSKADRLQVSIAHFIKRYKHIEFPPRFRNTSADVLTCTVETDFQKLLPVFLAGVFSKNQLHWEKKENPETKVEEAN